MFSLLFHFSQVRGNVMYVLYVMFVCMCVDIKKSDTVKSKNCFLSKTNMCINV